MHVLAILFAVANVFVGTDGVGHTTPAASWPFGMLQPGPDTSASPTDYACDWAHTSGYNVRDAFVWRFSQTHQSGAGCATSGDFGLLPVTEDPDTADFGVAKVVGSESAEPGYYAVKLVNGVACEMSTRAHAAAYRFRYPKGAHARLVFDLDWGLTARVPDAYAFGGMVFGSAAQFPTPTTARGYVRGINYVERHLRFAMAFSKPMRGQRLFSPSDGISGEKWLLDFGELTDGDLELAFSLSLKSTDLAAANLAREMPRFEFDRVRADAKAAWTGWLGRAKLDAGTDALVRDNFESALYRTAFQPNDVSAVGEEPCFVQFSLWDTFRAAHPLYTILAPEKVSGFVDSLLAEGKSNGTLPILSVWGKDTHCMIGKHAVPVIADAVLKGFVKSDVAKQAFAQVKDALTVEHVPFSQSAWGLMKEDWKVYERYGYYPFDMIGVKYLRDNLIVRGESASRTLEVSYDDACAARLAAAVGQREDADYFRRRSGNWKNLFDPSVGFIRGKDSKGRWREPFDPYALGGGPWTDNDFTEGNSWQYSWHVMHDVEGLMAAMGGREAFVVKLTQLLEQPPKAYKDRPTPDVSGLIGQYAHGNEPSHHVIYLFTLAGRPDLTAKYIRKVFATQYAPTPDGLCGNDDCGQMAAWYVFSALGFYPVDPCGGDYVVGAPQVPGATLRVGDGKTLRIRAENFGPNNSTVKAVTLNGRELADLVLKHAELVKGGELVFTMGR